MIEYRVRDKDTGYSGWARLSHARQYVRNRVEKGYAPPGSEWVESRVVTEWARVPDPKIHVDDEFEQDVEDALGYYDLPGELARGIAEYLTVRRNYREGHND